MKLLLVEDEIHFAEALKEILTKLITSSCHLVQSYNKLLILNLYK
ncbi:hypothetical protein [Clostridium sp.]